MRGLDHSLGRGLKVLQSCKVPPARLCHVSSFNDRRLSQHKRSVQTRLYHARVSDIHIKKSFLAHRIQCSDSMGIQKSISLLFLLSPLEFLEWVDLQALAKYAPSCHHIMYIAASPALVLRRLIFWTSSADKGIHTYGSDRTV